MPVTIAVERQHLVGIDSSGDTVNKVLFEFFKCSSFGTNDDTNMHIDKNVYHGPVCGVIYRTKGDHFLP